MAYKSLDDVLNRFQDRIIGVKSLETRDAVFERLPAGCHPTLKKGLISLGIKQLYTTKPRWYSEVEKGKNVIITTGIKWKITGFLFAGASKDNFRSTFQSTVYIPNQGIGSGSKAN